MSAAIVRGDALRLPFGDESVDLIVTSPPYFALRSYQDGGEHYDGQIGSEPTPQQFLEALWAVTAECWRALKPTGSLFLNLGDKYAGSNGQPGGKGSSTLVGTTSHTRGMAATKKPPDTSIRTKSLMGLPWRYAIGCIDGQADPDGIGWILRSEIVWSKPNGLPESVRDRVRRSHEQWFHLTKNGTYYADMDAVREPTVTDPFARPTWAERKAAGEPMRAGLAGAAGVGNVGMAGNPLGKLPDSVWTIATQPLVVPDELGVDHFAAFPTEWPRRIIAAWSPPGICTVCGEGRRTVSERVGGRVNESAGERAVARLGGQQTGGTERSTLGGGNASRLVTGTACACPDTSAPTTPAVVLDPFGGTGTTAMVARALGRFGVSVDLSADYLRLARWRIFDSDGAARVQARHDGRTYKPSPKPDPAQRDLFSLDLGASS